MTKARLKVLQSLEREFGRSAEFEDDTLRVSNRPHLVDDRVEDLFGNRQEAVDISMQKIARTDDKTAQFDLNVDLTNHRIPVADGEARAEELESSQLPNLGNVSQTSVGHATDRTQGFGRGRHHLSQMTRTSPIIPHVLDHQNRGFGCFIERLPQGEEPPGVIRVLSGTFSRARHGVTDRGGELRVDTAKVKACVP